MRAASRPWAGHLLGLALGGFFDGILLHQVLQWHHLLLGVQSGPFGDMRTQILADGLFHVLMYVIALAGLWSLWRARAQLTTRLLLADILVGFGAWHLLDGVLSHWLLGIHRVRMDSPDPLLWDLLWFVVFGLVPTVVGTLLRRRPGGADRAGMRSVAASLAAAVLIAGPVAALAPREARYVAVLVRPSQVNRLLDGLADTGGGILWADRSGALWILAVGPGADASRLRAHGALLVTRSPAALGCLAWMRSRQAVPCAQCN